MKKKIAIFGAGMSGLATAYTLTNDPGWSDVYDVTIYQLGWRVGGKTTTGRGKFDRIEEHGIHILQGWYENTFALLREVYAERADRKLDPNSPFQAWTDGFTTDDATLLTEWIPGRGWVNWPLVFPTNSATPGDGVPLNLMQLLKKGAGVFLETLLGSPYQTGQSDLVKWILSYFYPPGSTPPGIGAPPPLPVASSRPKPAWWHTALQAARAAQGSPPNGEPPLPDDLVLAYYAQKTLLPQLDAPPGAMAGPGLPHPREVLVGILSDVVAWLEEVFKDVINVEDRVRRVLILLDLAVVATVGLFEDVWDGKTFDFRRINDLDFRAWIAKHGATDRTLQSVVVRFLYTGTFANLTGGNDNGGLLAAGSALRFFLESAGYKGSFVWKFKAGTGDTMVMPFYEVLVARGVKFELFREVQKVHYSSTGAIECIDVGEQVTLKTPDTYVPYITVDNVRAWPAHPRYEQINEKEAAELQERHVDLEEPWADWKCPCSRTLKNGTDFDIAVLAIPVGTLKWICSEIVANVPAWKAMVDNVATVQTQAMQLWFSRDLAELGMNLNEWGMAETCAPNTVSYANPIYSWIDMSLVLPFETWPAGHEPKLCLYYTGPLADALDIPPPGRNAHRFPEQQKARVMAVAEQWLQDNMGWFWPKGTRPEAPQGLDLGLLTDGTNEKASPARKFAGQFFRANVAPWQRFTLAIPGTEKFRLKPDASGFTNMFLTGDWTDYGMNVGYIEGAITSGVLAGNAVIASLGCGEPRQLVLPTDLAR